MEWSNEQRSVEISSDTGHESAIFSVYDDGRDLAVFAEGHSRLIGICHKAFSDIEELGGFTPVDSGGFYCRVVRNPPRERLNLAFENVLAALENKSLSFVES